MMTRPANEISPLPADNRRALRQVVRGCRKAALATMTADGAPYVSLVTVAVDHDLAPVLLLSSLADHTRNLTADPRLSLLFDGTDGHPNPQTGPRVTLMGRAAPTDDPRLAARFLARHPGARLYAGFADFAFWRVVPERAHFVGGFGRAVWVDPPFGLPPGAATALAAAEAELVARLTADHAGALDRIAGEGGGWRLVGVDPDGIDLTQGDRFLRRPFPTPVEDATAACAALMAMVRDAPA